MKFNALVIKDNGTAMPMVAIEAIDYRSAVLAIVSDCINKGIQPASISLTVQHVVASPTKAELDERLAKLQTLLQDAVERHAYAENSESAGREQCRIRDLQRSITHVINELAKLEADHE